MQALVDEDRVKKERSSILEVLGFTSKELKAVQDDLASVPELLVQVLEVLVQVKYYVEYGETHPEVDKKEAKLWHQERRLVEGIIEGDQTSESHPEKKIPKSHPIHAKLKGLEAQLIGIRIVRQPTLRRMIKDVAEVLLANTTIKLAS